MLYEEKTQCLIRGLFEVQNEVGLGRREEAYHQAYRLWLDEAGVPYQSKAPHELLLDGQRAHILRPDFVAWDLITIELKAFPRRLHDEERVQIYDYLKCRGDRVGLLVNMGLDRVYVERCIYEPPPPELVEEWTPWSGIVAGDAQRIGGLVREALLAVYRAHGTGFGAEVTGRLVRCALNQRNLTVCDKPSVPATFRGTQVDRAPIDCLLIDSRLLLVFTALFDSNEFNISRGLSFLRTLGLEWGIAANFGKKTLELTGLRNSP